MATIRRLLALAMLGLAAGQTTPSCATCMYNQDADGQPRTVGSKITSLNFRFSNAVPIVSGQLLILSAPENAIFAVPSPATPITGTSPACTYTMTTGSIQAELRFIIGCNIAAGSTSIIPLNSAYLGTNPNTVNAVVIVNSQTANPAGIPANTPVNTAPANTFAGQYVVVGAVAVTCTPNPPPYTNGVASGCTNTPGGTCTIQCNNGFTPSTNPAPGISCVANAGGTAASWSAVGSCTAAAVVGHITNLAVEPSTFVGGDKLLALGIQYRPTVPIVSGDHLTFTADYPIFSGSYANARSFVVGTCRYTVVPSASDTMKLSFVLSDAVAGTACSVPTTSDTVFPLGAAYLGDNPPECSTVTITAVSTNAQGVVTNQMAETSYDTLCGGGSSGCWYLFFLFFLIPCCLIPCCCLLLFLRRRRNKPKGCCPPNACCPPQYSGATMSYSAKSPSSYVPPTMDGGRRPGYTSTANPFYARTSFQNSSTNPYSTNPYLSNPYLNPYLSAPAPTYCRDSSSPYYY